MPSKMKPAGYYTKAELAAEKSKKSGNTAPASSRPIGPSPSITINDTYFSTSKANKPAPAKKAAAPSRPKAEKASVMKGVGAKQIESPTTFKTADLSNLEGMAKNFGGKTSSPKETVKTIKKQNRIDNKIERTTNRQMKRADRIAKTESKGGNASLERAKLASGAKRLNKLRNK